MRMRNDRTRNPRVPLALFQALGLLSAAGAAEASCPDHMFIIERSTNANIVVYDANHAPDGQLVATEPVIVYWLMKAQEGQREELNLVERKEAYGIDIEPGAAPGTYHMALKADKKKKMTVALQKSCGVVLTKIGGTEGVLRRLYVKSKEEMIRPKVEYIEFFGEDPATGQALSEKYVP